MNEVAKSIRNCEKNFAEPSKFISAKENNICTILLYIVLLYHIASYCNIVCCQGISLSTRRQTKGTFQSSSQAATCY